ncbi:endonuclease/exonuclease/phosphatase family protein [Rhodobaculum claviforme]|uniref:Endonuclease/exonuclease/phosphatase domain-containing protein n=1 Tax=Rhodobaculum claviforme TaxID=1549854 RepID=A0A934TIQ6_9RHOB|nr:endonuclease/exonuclease/phosphatase family protein [Rhodobaculum claviforme]MBK5926216.1 hypothetical protein [Rhodobaculum claviforme]
MRIATFNVQNLRLRRGPGGGTLDGAYDGDAVVPHGGAAVDAADRRLTAAVIAGLDADVICLQEVYDLPSLDHFHDAFLRPLGVGPWPYRVCLPGNDGHGRDIAVMSRRPLAEVASHAALTAADLGLADLGLADPGLADPGLVDRPVFCRDCLRLRVGTLTLFVVHFKAPWPDPAAAYAAQRLEALAVRALVARRLALDADALWLVLGDFNEPADAPRPRAVAPLLAPFGCDLMARLPEGERWTYHLAEAGVVSCPDGMLAAPALARRWPQARPEVHRHGMPACAGGGARLCGVGAERPHASDHAALVIDLPGL